MGTNYYHRTNICQCCNRFNERHIGKSSAGWQFNFQGYNGYEIPNIISFEDWKKELQSDGKIFDEYGRDISFKAFVQMVKSKQSQPNNHYDYCIEQGYIMDNDWKDIKGYSFTSAEFS